MNGDIQGSAQRSLVSIASPTVAEIAQACELLGITPSVLAKGIQLVARYSLAPKADWPEEPLSAQEARLVVLARGCAFADHDLRNRRQQHQSVGERFRALREKYSDNPFPDAKPEETSDDA